MRVMGVYGPVYSRTYEAVLAFDTRDFPLMSTLTPDELEALTAMEVIAEVASCP